MSDYLTVVLTKENNVVIFPDLGNPVEVGDLVEFSSTDHNKTYIDKVVCKDSIRSNDGVFQMLKQLATVRAGKAVYHRKEITS